MIEAGLRRYEEINDEIKATLSKHNKCTVKDVNGQRYIGCALDEGKTIEIYGTPGTIWHATRTVAKSLCTATVRTLSATQ